MSRFCEYCQVEPAMVRADGSFSRWCSRSCRATSQGGAKLSHLVEPHPCNRCGVVREPHEFAWTNPRRRVRRRGICRVCEQAARDKNKSQDPERYRVDKRHYIIKNKYSLSREEWEALFNAQGSLCAVCGAPIDLSSHIDHDHGCCAGDQSCGECVRGILCRRCNLMLGFARDSSDLLTAAIRYLEGEAN